MSQSTPEPQDQAPIEGREVPPPPQPEAERLRAGRGKGRGKQMLRNLVTNFGTIALQMVLGMLLIRYLMRHLGPAEYGIVPLSFQIIAFFTLVTLSINASVGRYLTIDLTKNDLYAARRTFNSSFWGLMLVYVILIPLSVVLVWLSPQFLNYAEGAEAQSQRVLMAVAFSFFVTTAANSLMITAFARNRLDLQNYVRAAWHTVRTIIPIALIAWFGWGLDGVSVGVIIGSFVHLAMSVRIWRRLNPELRLTPKLFDRKYFLSLTDMSFWLMADRIGRMLQFNASIVVVNIVLGAAAAGRLGAIMIFARTLTMYNRSMRAVATPVIYAMYGRSNFTELRRFLVSFIRFEGIMLALPLGGFLVFAKPLLFVWLGPEFTDLTPVVNWMMIGLILTLPMVPLRAVFAATKHVREPGILSLLVGVVNVVVLIYMIHPGWGLNMGLVAAPISALFTTQLKNFFYVPLRIAGFLHEPWYTYYQPLLRIVGAYAFIIALSFGLRWWIHPNSWLELGLCGVLDTIIYLPVGLKFFMTKEDRDHIKMLRRRKEEKPPEPEDTQDDDLVD